MQPPVVPDPIHALAAACAAAGGRAYLVGGGVRDHLMGIAVKDWDVEVFGIPADRLAKLLRKRGSVNAVGRSFGVYKWRPRGSDPRDPEIDVSIPRRDSKVGPGHTGIAVEGDPDMDPVEAARRRDLTINALMWDLAGPALFDPWGGLADLQAERLRAVDDDTFLEDPLRALRVVQFAARLLFTADPALLDLCRQAALDELPAERIQGEWGKLLLKGQRPSVGLAVARDTAILERVFPEVADLDTDAVLDHLVERGWRDRTEPEGRRWALMLTGWLAPADPRAVEATLDRLWIHKVGGYHTRRETLNAVAHWRDPIDSDAALRWLSTRAEIMLALPVRGAVEGADIAGPWERAEALGVRTEPPPPLLQGRDLKPLGIPPGPHMGRLLKDVYARQLDGEVTTVEQARDAALTDWRSSSP